MVNAVANLSSERLSTKALAAAGQFRAIALWLNEPLIPQGIYAKVSPDKRPGCISIAIEFERIPQKKRLAQYICHLVWQLNSPLIEGVYITARAVGDHQSLWEERIRVMTPALKQRLNREQGQDSLIAVIPPQITTQSSRPFLPTFNLHFLFTEQLKTLRAFMLTGSAVAAFVFGCMVEVMTTSRPEPSLPFRAQESSGFTDVNRAQNADSAPTAPLERKEPQLPDFQSGSQTVTADQRTELVPGDAEAASPDEVTSVSFRSEPERDRPNVINAALEPVGVLKHDRLSNPNDPTVTLLFSGDVDLDNLPYEEFEYDGQLLSGIPAYQKADLAMINLQASLSVAATSLEENFLERQRPEAINLLKAGGVDVVNLTGEESLAFGEQGLTETLENLDRNGIFRVGAGRNEREARRPEIIDVKGQRIAYLSYDRNLEFAAYDSVGGVNAPPMQNIIQDIQAIRDEVDWLVVNYRWTAEPPESPAESQTNLARLAIDQGADLVIGHHPTQLQGAEIYKGRPIAYSLGDFVFTSATSEMPTETAVLQVSLRDQQMKVDLIPVKVRNGQPHQVNGNEAERILNKVQSASKEFAQPMPKTIILNTRSVPSDISNPDEQDAFTQEESLRDADIPETQTDNSGADLPSGKNDEMPSLDEGISPDLEQPTTKETTVPDTPTSEGASLDSPNGPPSQRLDVEMAPIPDGLLDGWGPKDSPNTLYEPESLLPNDSPLKQPKSKPTRSPEVRQIEAPKNETEKQVFEHPQAEPMGDELEVHQPVEVIPPHSEPLVGPLSALPASSPEMKMPSAAIAAPPQAGMPESQVFQPLNTLEPANTKMITIEAQSKPAADQANQP